MTGQPLKGSRKKVVKVAAAIIRKDGQVLICLRRPDAELGGLWEFPGGKCRPDESLEDCLAREVREELDIAVAVGELACEILYPYPEYTVILHFFHCTIRSGEPRPLACEQMRWVIPPALSDYAFPPADLPLVRELMRS